MDRKISQSTAADQDKGLPWGYKLLTFGAPILTFELVARIFPHLILILLLNAAILIAQVFIFRRLKREARRRTTRDFKLWTISGYILFALIYLLPLIFGLIFAFGYR